MKISTYLVQIRKLIDGPGFEAAMKRYYDMGITAADVIESELAEHSLAEYDKAIRASGMSFGAFVATADIITARGAELEKNLSLVKGYIDELDRLGVPMIMLAPSVVNAESPEEFNDMRERMVEGFGAMADYAEGSGVKVMIENQSVAQRADSYIKDCKYIIDQLPKLGFVLDAGNFWCVREDVLEAYEVFKGRIVHSHIKDWEYYEYGRIVRSYMPPLRSAIMGRGLLPLDTLLERMKKDGYSGRLLLEINGRPFTTKLTDESLRFMKKYCD